MFVAAVLRPVTQLVVWATDKVPQDEDVKAGWTAFVLFLLLLAAVVVLGFSLAKQLRKAQAAKDAGVFGDEDEPAQDSGVEPENHSAT